MKRQGERRSDTSGLRHRPATLLAGWLVSMKMRVFLCCAVLTAAVSFAVERKTIAQTNLQVTYGPQGVQQISYRGVPLEDVAQNPADAFHIWHMKMTDLRGNLVTAGQYGWGETNNGRQWDAGSKTWIYPFTWGSIRVQFQQSGDTLNMNVTEINSASSGMVLNGASIFPFVLHFPNLPTGFNNASYPQLSYNTTGPSALAADFGSGLVAAVVPSTAKPLYSGFMPAGQANSYTPLISSTAPDGLATFQPHLDRPVMPGQTDTFTVSLRFAASGTSIASLAQDADQSWAKTWPASLQWTDRRIIGSAYLASSPTGDASKPGGYPNNPRRYFNDAQANDFDVRSAAGLSKFQRRVLDQATATVGNLQQLHAQGVVTWDIEGEEYPQETSYVCSPDQIATVAPEMESVLHDPSSRYNGMKLDDAYFRTIHDAGYRVGVCVRPQQFVKNADGTAGQSYLPDSQVAAQLIRKMKFAHDRWGATLFYLDSTVEMNGATLDASIFQQAAAALPDSLLIPEESSAKFYAYAAPFKTFLFHGDLGTDASIYSFYPRAFSVNMINDVDPGKLAAARSQLTDAVRHGDILMVHADYWQANNPTVVQIYTDAGSGTAQPTSPLPVATPVPTPGPTTPSPPAPIATTPAPSAPVQTPISSGVAIMQPANDATLTGAITVLGQVAISLDAAGSYLMVDGVEIGTHRVVERPFQYPLDTKTLADGPHTLQLWAHDTGNNTVLSGTVKVTVLNTGPVAGANSPAPAVTASTTDLAISSPVQLTYPQSGQAISGVIEVAAAIARTLDAAGSYLLIDGAQAGWRHVGSAPFLYEVDTSTLSVGQHTLQILARDIANETLLSNSATVVVVR